MSAGGDRKVLGRWGESQAAGYLRKQGCTLLCANWRCRMGEIDLIAADRRYIRFVEVKLRKDDRFMEAREAVDYRKQQRLKAAAALYLTQRPTRLQPRFDVAEVYAPDGVATPDPRIVYIEDAFE